MYSTSGGISFVPEPSWGPAPELSIRGPVGVNNMGQEQHNTTGSLSTLSPQCPSVGQPAVALLLPPATAVSAQAVCLLTRQAGRWAHLVLNPSPGPAESNLIPQAHSPWAGQLPTPHSPHARRSPGTSFLQDRTERTTKRNKGEGISRGRTEAPRLAVLFPDAQMFPSISAHHLPYGGSGAGPRLPCGGRISVFTPNALGHPS